MTPQELRIGNLVLYKDCLDTEDGIPEIIEIKSINQDGINLSWNNIYDQFECEYYFSNDCEIIEGLPLTEEWLLNLGFKNTAIKWKDGSASDNVWQKKGKYSIEFTVEGIIFYIFLGLDGNPVFLNYTPCVHQLQNLYFTLTGEELTIKNEITH